MSSGEIVPPRVDGFSEPIRSFGGCRWLSSDTLIFGGGLTSVGILGVSASVAIVLLRLTEKPAFVSSLVGGGAVIALAIGGAYLVFSFLASRRTTWVFPEGVVRTGVFKTRAIRWSRVDQLTDVAGVGSVHLRDTAGQTLTFYADEISPDLYALVRDHACAQMVPRFRAEMAAGKTFQCGPFTVDKTGLRFQAPDGTKKEYAWRDVADWFYDNSGLACLVTRDGVDGIGVRWSAVPNLTVLILAGKAIHAEE